MFVDIEAADAGAVADWLTEQGCEVTRRYDDRIRAWVPDTKWRLMVELHNQFPCISDWEPTEDQQTTLADEDLDEYIGGINGTGTTETE